MSDFVALLEALSLPDNTIRSAAEETYRQMKENEQSLLPMHLLEVVAQQNISAKERQMAAVLLRRMLVEEEVSAYKKLSEQHQQMLRVGLLQSLENESDPILKARICDIVGELAGYILDESEWPEVLPFAYANIQSTNPLNRQSGIGLFGMLANSASQIEKLQDPANMPAVLLVFEKLLEDVSNDGKIIVASMRALSTILTTLPRESDLDKFQSLMGHIMTALNTLIAGVSSGQLPTTVPNSFVESLVDIVEERGRFFSPQLAPVFEVTMGAIENSDTQPNVRHLLLEFLVGISSSCSKSARKLKGPSDERAYFFERLFRVCSQMMTMLPEDPSWDYAQTVEESSDALLDSDVGETCLDRVAQALGVKYTMGVMSGCIGTLLSSGDWRHQYAGLRCMGNYLEVSANIPEKSQLQQHRSEVITTLLTYCQSPVPRVKATAYYAVEHLLINHGQGLKAEQFQPLLARIMSDVSASINPSPRVRKNVLNALYDLINISPNSFIEAHVEGILTSVVACLNEGPVIVQESCVTVIIALANSIRGNGQSLAPYYDALMPILKSLLEHARANGLETLFGQTLECCAMIGEASGKTKFYADALEMMNKLVSLQGELSEDSEVGKYLMKAWVRIARSLGVEFLPFLTLVMDKLLAAVGQDVTAGVGDLDLDDIDERSDIEVIETEDGMFMAVRTSAVEEQACACQLMVLIMEKLQEHFFPYVEQTVRVMTPLLESPHEDVRSYCMVAVPELVRSTAKYTIPDRSSLAAISEFCMGQLVKAIDKECNLDLVMTGLQALKSVLIYACSDWASLIGSSPDRVFMDDPPNPTPASSIKILSADQMTALSECAKIILKDSLQRRAVMRAEAQVSGGADEDDAVEEAMFLQQSMELHYNIAELIGCVFKTHGSDYIPSYNEHWHEIMTQLLQPICLKEDRQFALYMVCDVIEFGLNGDMAVMYFEQMLPAVIQLCGTSPEPGPRQASSYALGVACEKYPVEFAAYASSALQALAASIGMGEDGDDMRGECTDNSVSAVGIILDALESTGIAALDYPSMWGHWLAYLPLQHDKEEGVKVNKLLLKLFANRNASLLTGIDRLGQSIQVMLQVLDTDLATPEINHEIMVTLRLLRVGARAVSEEDLSMIASNLTPELTAKLERVLSMHVPTFGDASSSPGPSAPIHDVLYRG